MSVEVEKQVSGGKKLAVWEEALLQEFIYLIGHLNHSEQHLLEADAYIGRSIFGDLVNIIREYRKRAGHVLFMVEKLEAEGSSSEFRTSWESIWCTLKHLTTALIHTDEVLEKILRRMYSGGDGTGDTKAYGEQVNILLGVRRGILEAINNLITRAKTLSNIINFSSIRCRDDLCIEEIEERNNGKE